MIQITSTMPYAVRQTIYVGEHYTNVVLRAQGRGDAPKYEVISMAIAALDRAFGAIREARRKVEDATPAEEREARVQAWLDGDDKALPAPPWIAAERDLSKLRGRLSAILHSRLD